MDTKKRITISSWNINGLLSRHKNKLDDQCFLGDIMKSDIIGLVETHLNDQTNICLDGYSVYQKNRPRVSRARRDHGGLIVLTRNCIKSGIKHLYCPNPNYHWIKLEKTFFSLEDDIYICFAHIPPQNSTYTLRTGDIVLESIAKDISKYSKHGLTMLCGDLNARIGTKNDLIERDDDKHTPNPVGTVPDSFIISRHSQDKHISPRGNSLLELCMSSHMRVLNGRTLGDCLGKFTCHNPQGSSVVDYALVSETLYKYIMYFHVHDFDATLSDHCKLSLQINVTIKKAQEKCPIKLSNLIKKYKWHQSAPSNFSAGLMSNNIQRKVGKLMLDANTSNKTSSDEYAVAIQDIFITAAEQSLPKKIPPSKRSTKRKYHKPWYDFDLKCLRLRVQAGSKQLASNPSDPVIRGLFFRDVKNYNKQRKRKIQIYKRNLMTNLEQLESNNPKQFWELLEKLKVSTTNHPHKSPGNNISPNDWYDYFKLLNSIPQQNIDIEKRFGETLNTMEKSNIFNELCYTITESEVSKAISRLKNGKAVGLDGISNEMIKASQHILLQCLTKVFNTIFVSGKYPKCWAEGYLTPIFKANDSQNPYNYRGIAVNSCVGKLFNSILNARLDQFLENRNIIDETQIGFRKKARTADHIFVIKTLLNKYFQQGSKIYACFIDFTKAFDRVSRNCLLSTLLHYNIGGSFFQIIKSMLSQSQLCVKVNNQFTPFFKSDIGVRQGDPLSANLFNISINKISSIFNEQCTPVKLHNKHLNCLLYADDVVLLSKTKAGLQNCITLLKRFCNDIGMEINCNKSKIMIFNKAGKLIPTTFSIGNNQLELTKEYKYLGIILTPSGSFSTAKEQLYKKSLKAHFKLCSTLQDLNKPDLGLHLFNHTITPILTYCSEIWGAFNPTIKNIDTMSFKSIYMHSKIEKTQKMFARFLLGIPKYCQTEALLGELGWNPLYSQIISSVIKYWHRLSTMGSTSLLGDALLVHKELQIKEYENVLDTVQLMLNKLNITLSLTDIENLSEGQMSKIIKSHITETIDQEWHMSLQDDNRKKPGGKKLRLYRQFKRTYLFEPYLKMITNKCHRIDLCKLRTSCHPLLIEQGRYQNIEVNNRLCTLCNQNKIETEDHFLLECSLYHDERKAFLQSLLVNYPTLKNHTSIQLFIWLMSCEDITVCRNTAKLISECFAKRKRNIN
jgi:exonuclease III